MIPPTPRSWTNATLCRYQALPERGKLGLPELRPVLFRVSTCAMDTEEKLVQRVRDFEPTDGWLRCQSKLAVCWNGSWTRCQGSGLPLAGELNKGQQSVILRYAGEGWKWTVLTVLEESKSKALEESEEGKGDYKPFLAQELDLLAENEMLAALTGCTGRWKLRYDVLWRIREGEPSQRAAYRFKGFVEEKD